MAKFTKLNIGDSVASSGGRVWKKLSSILQLSAPTLSLDGDTLTITDDSKLATSFDILVDGEVKGTATSTTFDLSALGLESGTYSISVIAKADGYKDSAESEAVSYEVSADELAGTWVLKSTPSGTVESFVNFISNGATFSRFSVTYSSVVGKRYIWYYDSSNQGTRAYNAGTWSSNNYKTIFITSKLSEVDNGNTLLTWLKANATKTA